MKKLLCAFLLLLSSSGYSYTRPVDTLVIHHSATESGDVNTFRQYHMEVRGWQDVGYHYVLTKDGQIQVGRPENIQGAHAKGRNKGSIGICVVGTNTYTDRQMYNLVNLIDKLEKKYGDLNIEFHHEKCPGDTLLSWIKRENYA